MNRNLATKALNQARLDLLLAVDAVHDNGLESAQSYRDARDRLDIAITYYLLARMDLASAWAASTSSASPKSARR